MAKKNGGYAGERLLKMTAEATRKHELEIQQHKLKIQQQFEKHCSELQTYAVKSIPTLLNVFEQNSNLREVEAQIYPFKIIRKVCGYKLKCYEECRVIVAAWATHEDLKGIRIIDREYSYYLRNYSSDWRNDSVTFSWEKNL
jgi:hypothetical protein